MNKEQLHDIISGSTGNEKNICQIYALKDGKEVYLDNFKGFGTSDAMHLASVTKGIMSILTGIAIDNGYISSVDQKVMEFFPDYTVKRGEKTIYDVTIRHLLTMTAPYKYRTEPWKKVCTSDDWTVAALDLLGGRSGITGEFKYATLGIQILTGIIERSSGQKCLELANSLLFAPLGIPEVKDHGDSSAEDQFNYVTDKSPRRHEWYSDPGGSVTAGWGLCLSAYDLARIGQMLLDNGTYNGKKILSECYIDDMTSAHLKLGETFGNMDYGYLWYRPYEDRNVFAAIGDGGNVIYVNKDMNIAVGVTGSFRPRIFDRVDFIEKNVLPIIEA